MIENKEQQDFIAGLYMKMRLHLCTYAMRVLDNRDLAEEAVQDTFRIACAKADTLCKSENPEGWVFNTLKYVLKNTQRSIARMSKLVACALAGDQLVVSDGSEVEFEATYSSMLGERDFQLVKMIVLEQCTMLDAANRMGISVGACRKRLQRAKRRLEEAMRW